MPNDEGLYTLKELRDFIRRRLNALRPTAVAADGAEGPVNLVNMIPTNEDLNLEINTALTGAWVTLVENSTTAFADEEIIDVHIDQTEYSIPADTAFIRGLFWKEPTVLFTVVPRNDRKMMPFMDGDTLPTELGDFGPAWRMILNQIVLNDIPKTENPGGILVWYVKHVLYLQEDGAFIELQFARILQEIVIWEAAINILATRMLLVVPDSWQASLAKWQQNLSIVARNNIMPPFITMVPAMVPFRQVGRRGRGKPNFSEVHGL